MLLKSPPETGRVLGEIFKVIKRNRGGEANIFPMKSAGAV